MNFGVLILVLMLIAVFYQKYVSKQCLQIIKITSLMGIAGQEGSLRMKKAFPIMLNSIFFIAGICSIALDAPLPCALCLFAISILFLWTYKTQQEPDTAAAIDDSGPDVEGSPSDDIQQTDLALRVQELTMSNQLLNEEIEKLRMDQKTCLHPIYSCPLTSALPVNLDHFFTAYIKNRFEEIQNSRPCPKYHCSIPEAETYLSTAALSVICDNVIDNMLKFSPAAEDTREDIYITITDIGNDSLIIFKNKGEGISEHEASLIFGLNYQGSNKKGGTGLGLAQVDALVSDYGGRAWAKSSRSTGFTLYIQLPPRADPSSCK